MFGIHFVSSENHIGFDISFRKNAINVYAKALHDQWEKAF